MATPSVMSPRQRSPAMRCRRLAAPRKRARSVVSSQCRNAANLCGMVTTMPSRLMTRLAAAMKASKVRGRHMDGDAHGVDPACCELGREPGRRLGLADGIADDNVKPRFAVEEGKHRRFTSPVGLRRVGTPGITQDFGLNPVVLVDVEVENAGIGRQVEVCELATEARVGRERRTPAAALVVVDGPSDIGGDGLGQVRSKRDHEVHGNVADLERTRDFDRVVPIPLNKFRERSFRSRPNSRGVRACPELVEGRPACPAERSSAAFRRRRRILTPSVPRLCSSPAASAS